MSVTAEPEGGSTPDIVEPRKPSRGAAIWREVKGMLWVLLAVLGFHSFVAKPFYIPSESMMPVLLKGDRLVVSKYPYGWSYVSPTIPNPAAIVRSLFLGTGEAWGVTLPFSSGRVFGDMPTRGDIVIVTPPGQNNDYIKRVIGLPGDTLEMRGGRLILNGRPVQAQVRPDAMIPVDFNAPCGLQFSGHQVRTDDGQAYCRLPIVRETLPNGVSYDTIDLGPSQGDDFGPIRIPAGHLFLMGDNRDRSADSRFPLEGQGLGGPVPWENIGGPAGPPLEEHLEQPGPTEFRDPRLLREFQRAAVWLGMALLIVGVVVLAQPLLLIIGGLVFSVILDGGARLLGRVLPIGRGWRLAIVTLAGFGFIGWVFYYAGTTFAAQFDALRLVVTAQFDRVLGYADELGLIREGSAANLGEQVLGSVGRLTSAVGSALGALASALMIVVIGLFIAMEPRLYDRGLAWMLPVRHRTRFYEISNRVGFTLRRLLAGRIVGMVFEGIFTWIMLMIGGVPMAALLGLITGLLAFIPNIGAIISGVLMVAVGFSAGTGEGFWAIFVYFFVQNVDGYVVVPYIARRTVDLAPALVLAAQLVFGALFGILGILLADPIVATIKVTLQELSRSRAARAAPGVENQSPG